MRLKTFFLKPIDSQRHYCNYCKDLWELVKEVKFLHHSPMYHIDSESGGMTKGVSRHVEVWEIKLVNIQRIQLVHQVSITWEVETFTNVHKTVIYMLLLWAYKRMRKFMFTTKPINHIIWQFNLTHQFYPFLSLSLYLYSQLFLYFSKFSTIIF